jgi:hypothetical protein
MSSLKREPLEFDDDDEDDMIDDDDEDDVAMDATMALPPMSSSDVSDLSMKVEPDSGAMESELRPAVRTAPPQAVQSGGRSSRRKPAAPQWVNPEWQEVADVGGIRGVGAGSREEKREVIINGVCVMQTDAPFSGSNTGVGVGSSASPGNVIEDEEEEEEDEEDGPVDHTVVGGDEGQELGSGREEDEPMDESGGGEGQGVENLEAQSTDRTGGVDEELVTAESPRRPCRSDDGVGGGDEEVGKGVESDEDPSSAREDRIGGPLMSDSGCADERGVSCVEGSSKRSTEMRDDDDEAAMDESLEKLQKRMKREEEEEEEDWEF